MASTGSLWSQVRELEGDALRQIQSLYDTNFPIEFRHYFAEVIERQPWDQPELKKVPFQSYFLENSENIFRKIKCIFNFLRI